MPAAYVVLESLPLTVNGKLDRKALPVPQSSAVASQSYEPPQGPIEPKLAQIWQALLQVERVGRHDNFFALGGDSILSIRAVTQRVGRGWALR